MLPCSGLVKFYLNSISTSMRLSSFYEHVNAIEQLPRSTSITDQLTTSITDQRSTSTTAQMTTSNTDRTTSQRLQDDISDTIEAISIQTQKHVNAIEQLP